MTAGLSIPVNGSCPGQATDGTCGSMALGRDAPRMLVVASGDLLVRVPLTLLRRIATSLMLLAMAALAVNVAAVPASAFGPVEHLEYAGPEHSHMHGDGTVHSHVIAKVAPDEGGWPDFPRLDDPQDHEHDKADCCGLTHPVALPSAEAAAPAPRTRSGALFPQESRLSFGAGPNGPRRPPRLLPNA